MSEHLTEQEVELYRRRAIDPLEGRSLYAHLNACEDCLRRALDPKYSNVALTSLTEAFLPPVDEEPFHLSREDLKKYLAGTADEADRIVCESHLDICTQCKEEALAVSVAGQRAEPVRGGAPARTRGPSLKERFTSLWQWPVLGTPVRVAIMLALFGSVLLAGLVWYRSRRAWTPGPAAQTAPGKNEAPPAQTPESGPDVVKPREETAALPPSDGNSQATSRQAQSAVAGNNGPGNSSPVVMLKDNGREIKLDGQGNLSGLEELAPTAQRAVKTVLANGSLPAPQGLDELSAPGIKLMGPGDGETVFKLVSPLGRVIREDRPVLRWRPLSGATSYTVSLFDADFNRVARSAPQSATEWRVPVGLQRGRIYSWEVTAQKDGREINAPVAPQPRAQFKVVEAERLEELSVLQRRSRSHLALGVMYARSGLLAVAEREFQQLLKDNPHSSLARKLLRTVQAWQNR
jgi:hypothetical protein